MRNDLYCYTCGFPSPAYTCPYCGGTDVEPYDTDGGCDQLAEALDEALKSAAYDLAHPADWYGPGASDEDAANYEATHALPRWSTY